MISSNSKISSKLSDILRGSKPYSSLTSEIFPPIDKKKVIKDLFIESRGEEDGKNNFPPSDKNIDKTLR